MDADSSPTNPPPRWCQEALHYRDTSGTGLKPRHMATGDATAPLRGLCFGRRSSCNNSTALPDAELLSRFAGQRDGEAFAALVRRHGTLVHAVARRQLHDSTAADDVFQATFLRSGTAGRIFHVAAVRRKLAVRGVAFRLARRARSNTAARRRRS